MTDLEINQKLAEAMGIRVSKSKQSDCLWIDNGEITDIWDPVHDMTQAWEVAEAFGLDLLVKTDEGDWQVSMPIDLEISILHVYAIGKSASLAICKAALKVIENQEGSKDNEQGSKA